MSDLTEILKMQWEAYPNALKTGQEAQSNAIALDNARRAQQEREGLKALYAQQANPSYQAIGAISPEYAQSAMKNQLELQQAMIGMRHQQAQTGEIEDKMDRERAKIRAQTAVPIVDMYYERLAKGVPQGQALQMFHSESGQALSNFQQQGLIDKNFPPYDPNTISPEAVENASAGLGFPSRRLLALQEASKTTAEQQARVRVGPVMTPEQARGSVEIDPATGLPFFRPPLSANQPPVGAQLTGNEGAGYTPEQNAQFNVLQELLNANPNDEALRRSVIAQRQKIELQGGEQPSMPQSEIVTPQQLSKARVEQAAEKEGALITAKQQAEEQQTINKSLNSFETLPDINHIRDLVKGSIGSDIEYWTNRFGQTIGESLASGDIQSALAVVANDMANTVPFAPGSQSDKELAQRLKQVGNLESDMTIDQKMAAFEEWFKKEQRYIGKYGKYSDAELLDLGREGKITHETAMKVRANRNKGQ
jgi:hypothetical protein